MAIRQSVLALFGAITDGLNELNEGRQARSPEAYDLRETSRELVGLGGSAGERGWYEELLRYFDTNRIDDQRVVAPGLDEVHADLESNDETLHPTWASRAIYAAYVLDRLSDFNVGPARDFPRFLAPTLAASPSEGPGWNETRKLGPEVAEEFAGRLMETRANNLMDFRDELKTMAGQLNYATATIKVTAGLRKVKREYCSVIATKAVWPDIDYTKLKKAIEPSNWDNYYHEFFCDMEVLGTDAQGWTRIHEAVSGECSRYRLDTGLKFWKANRASGIFINYDMDPDRSLSDKLVLVDNGYIWITPLDPAYPDQGVRVRTSKELLISGMSATAMTKMAESMGYATNSTDMFYAAAKYANPVDPWTPSVPKKPAVADTSVTWPVIVPELPPDIRDEYCADTTGLIKKNLDAAHLFGCEFIARWEDGIDLNDANYLNDKFAAGMKTASKEAFDVMTENFRPKMPSP